MKTIALLAAFGLALGLGACNQTVQAPAPQLSAVQAPATQAIQTRPVKYKVYTAKTLRALLDEAKANGTENQIVLVTLTPKGYENQTFNTSELERFVREQREVILFYKSTIDGRAAL